jgi:hypothetical protein
MYCERKEGDRKKVFYCSRRKIHQYFWHKVAYVEYEEQLQHGMDTV